MGHRHVVSQFIVTLDPVNFGRTLTILALFSGSLLVPQFAKALAPTIPEVGLSENGLTGVIIAWRSEGAEALPYVQKVLIGSPAERAGVRNGDIYTHVDGHPLKGLAQKEAMQFIRGLAGTTMRLRVIRPGVARPLFFSITRESAESVRARDRTLMLPP
jgi:S1-C subfamily serine protease